MNSRPLMTIALPSGLTSEIWAIVQSKYISVGWSKVTWESDQRDGDYLQFVK